MNKKLICWKRDWSNQKPANAQSNNTRNINQTYPSLQQDPNIDPNLKQVLHDLEAYCNQNRISGAVTYIGTFGSGGRQSTWISNKVKVDDSFALIEDRLAEKVLACIGNADRLNILLSIIKKPMTVAKLVEECGFNSTGAGLSSLKTPHRRRSSHWRSTKWKPWCLYHPTSSRSRDYPCC